MSEIVRMIEKDRRLTRDQKVQRLNHLRRDQWQRHGFYSLYFEMLDRQINDALRRLQDKTA